MELLTGPSGLNHIMQARVIIFGVGGVGSWTAESLIRSGIQHLTVVDADIVTPTNINRQLMALNSTIGQSKAETLASRLRDINPEADIKVISKRYNPATATDFDLGAFDYIIDAIDSLADKASLILNSTSATTRPKLFSSMGAALRLDPSRIKTAEFWKVTGDPLAAALRRRFRKNGTIPSRKFKCVYSDELLANHPDAAITPDNSMTFDKVAVNGAAVHITAIFGFTLASLVINDILNSIGTLSQSRQNRD